MKNSRIFDTRRAYSRRTVLRGAGVALTLPWLESLLPREARAQAAKPRLRYVPIYLPCGAPERWKPPAFGSGDAWALSSVLEPLSALKPQLTVLSGLENASVFNVGGSTSVEPPSRQAGGWLTCVDSVLVRQQLQEMEANGISVDQLIASSPAFQNVTPIPSLQVGLSTTESYCDGQPCSLSRSISWRTPTLPLFKTIDPKQVFDALMSAGDGSVGKDAERIRQSRQSVLDAVLESAAVVAPKLSAHDKLRMDEFFDSVRGVERDLNARPAIARSCSPPARQFSSVTLGFRQNTAEYDKGSHADAMNDLIALAFQCDLTRVISYMLEDERSEFTYDHVPKRKFTALASTPSTGVCGSYNSAQMGLQDDYASITHWNVGKVAELCQKLAALDDGNGQSVLDNSVVFLGAAMHGNDFRCSDLPALLLGSAGGRLKTDQHLALTKRALRDLYFSLMNGVYGMNVADFGVNRDGVAISQVSELFV